MLRAAPFALLSLLATSCTPTSHPTRGAGGPSSAARSAVVDGPASPPATAAAPTSSASYDAVASDASHGSKLLRITTAMPMGGEVDAKALVAALDGQLAPLEPCVALIRKTDQVVGSLNLQVTVAKSGATTVALQSPVNADAERCLLQGMQSWRAARAGAGAAMVLLELSPLSANDVAHGSQQADPTSVGCNLLPQPSLPGHTSVEPKDMACTHGDLAFTCPPSFDGARFHCRRSTAPTWKTLQPWCCPTSP